MIEIIDKVYDHGFDDLLKEDLGDAATEVTIRCKHCGNADDPLVEFTMVPRHMGAVLFRTPEGYVADLITADDEAFWEAETNHKWACRSCTTDSEDINEVFEVINDGTES